MRTVGKRLLLVLVFTLAVGALSGVIPLRAQVKPVVDDAMLAEFEAMIEAEMAYLHTPGMAAVVIQDGKVLYAKGFGLRNVETGAPFTTQTRFRIGSTTKSMTSLLAAQLVDEGKLAWDTPVASIWPGFRTADEALTAQIRVRDLMGMATGLNSVPVDGMHWGEWDVNDLFDAVAAQPVANPFGQVYSYNNEVYATAGYIATIASGLEPTLESYRALIQKRLFDPLGMKSAIITDDISQLGEDYAASYDLMLGESIETPNPVLNAPIGVLAPAGAVWVNIEDMARYVIAQMNGGLTPEGTRIVSAGNLAETWKQQVGFESGLPLVTDGGYGMGWVTERYRTADIRYHNGGWDGYRTQMAIYPEANAAVILFGNHMFSEFSTMVLSYGFAELLYDLEPMAVAEGHKLVDAQLNALKPLEALLTDELDVVTPERAAPLVGQYEDGWQIVYHEADQTLWLERPGFSFRLAPLMGNFIAANGIVTGAMISAQTKDGETTLKLQAGAESVEIRKVGP